MTLYVFRECTEAPENNSLIRVRRESLRSLIASKAYKHSKKKEFKLSSGKKSNQYLDCRVALGHVNGLKYASTCLRFATTKDMDVYAGVATGGISLASSLSQASSYSAWPKPWFFIRSKAKTYGAKNLFEGHVPEDARVSIVDDVITTGKSIVQAIQACRNNNLKVVEVLSIVVRDKSGVKAIEKECGEKIPIKTLFMMDEIHEEYVNILND